MEEVSKMRTKEEIINELQYRCQFIMSQSESYSSYRANTSFIKGMLFCLGYNLPTSYNLATIIKQFNIKQIKREKSKKGKDFEIKELKIKKTNYFRKPKLITDEQIKSLKKLIEETKI